jgi:hypothetical protein
MWQPDLLSGWREAPFARGFPLFIETASADRFVLRKICLGGGRFFNAHPLGDLLGVCCPDSLLHGRGEGTLLILLGRPRRRTWLGRNGPRHNWSRRFEKSGIRSVVNWLGVSIVTFHGARGASADHAGELVCLRCSSLLAEFRLDLRQRVSQCLQR